MSSNADHPGPQFQPPATPGDFPSESDNREPSPDAPLDPSSLPRAVKARRSEYTRQRSIRIKVGSWNVAALPGTEQDVGNWFADRKGISEEFSEIRVSDKEPESEGNGDDATDKATSPSETEPNEVGLYALGLQEIVDVSSPAEALRPYVDPAPASKWKAAVQKALPSGYQLVAETQLVGLLLLIYASPSVVDSVSSVSCANVGTGLLGYMGNKGGVAARLLLGETTGLVFVNCHLAAGSDKGSLDRRNWDASQIVGRAKFDAIDSDLTLRDEPTESIGKEDFAFWFGDLNYRLEDIPGDDVRQVLARHAEDENTKEQRSNTSSVDSDDDTDPHSDPASLQTTISSLLPHDQLRLQQAKYKAFHDGWREGDISFLPTYKYDVGSVARFDSSEKQRGPSWCDRILYRSRQDRERYERLVAETADSRKRDDEMKARGLDKAAADDNVLFDYDPDVDGADDAEEYDPTNDQTSDGASFQSQSDSEDPLRLEYYASHQKILSSDHKPLAAGFTLSFESVIPHLKAKVHQEVVRELDRAENESRPGLTVVVDRHGVYASKDDSDGDPNAVNFGDIPFDVPVRRSMTVANTSGVPATFTLEKPEGADGWMVSWLEYQVEMPHRDDSEEGKYVAAAQECVLHPGELANVELTAYVRDIELARALNDGKTQLEEILVLRVVSGRDHFISAYGKWLPTCFGRSLEDLTLMPEAGARTMSPVGISAAERGKQNKDVPLSAPRELFRLTEAISELTERAAAEWSMTRDDSDDDTPPWLREPHGAGWPFAPETWTLKDKDERMPLLASAREALDTSQSFNDLFAPEVSSLHRLEILSETLIVFLGSLQDGIVTASVWQDLDQQILTREKAKASPLTWEESQAWVLESLAYSPAHSVSFTFVTFMLARVANEVAPATSIPSRGSSNKPSEEEAKSNTKASDNTTQPSTPTSPSAGSFISGGSLRRRTRTFTSSSVAEPTINPLALRRQTVETVLSGIFSSLLISSDIPIPTKDKERRALEDRKRSIVEPFLKAMGVDNKGPSGGVP
ncbi:phosphatase family protein [Aspergillus steynii IBT 23096]|uniref:Phosphatase family protein n=1 Tax=Aspergillus steynii IBT 23096 TaxID=1392250 RepID=A0A2I2GL94_9EURO|nr:phosphatase family protein [Aspergillus steynii IBT 23096]PLB53651.1 phosphatase family protein [Aspergillus steynii IBT 23096]